MTLRNLKRRAAKWNWPASLIRLLVVLAVAATATCVREPNGPATDPLTRWRAQREGGLVVYTNTSMMQPVIDTFQDRWPMIKVQVVDRNSSLIAEEVKATADAGRPGVDLVWSSAMDQQIKLVNDGYAQAYRSPHRRSLPDGAIWRSQGFGLTADPIVFVYNRRLLPADATPRSHAELLRLLSTRPDAFAGRTTLYDVERSAVGMMLLSADIQAYPDAWRLMEALGRTAPRLDTSGHRMLGQIADGRKVFAYNVNRSFAAGFAADHDEVAVIVPSDYRLSVSRVAFIPRNASHPAAARLFLDFLLSREGQELISRTGAGPVRVDMADVAASPGLRSIRVGPGLLANLDQLRRRRLITQWRTAMVGAEQAPDDPFAP